MINITKKEKEFIKANREVLAGLFQKRIDDLKEQLLMCPEDDRGAVIKMINEFKSWLLTIHIFSKRKTKETKENFI